MFNSPLASVGAALLAVAAAAPASTSLPIVDLGNSVHQAIVFNDTGNYYNFSNIRYGQPPVGSQRFRAPVAVSGRNTTVDNGSIGRVCPQGFPSWLLTSLKFAPAYLSGQQYTPAPPPGNGTTPSPPPDPRITEDCLFLDVIVPKTIMVAAKAGKSDAPVLVWIYGGGYVLGEKSDYDPRGLLKNSPEPFIFVALNYRLGAFGFLGGPSADASGTPQPGLLDQRLALEWVKTHINRFGGSSNRVTVMGESAGGGSIMHQITAYGGQRGPVPFQRAILQSPGSYPLPHIEQVENSTKAFLRECNVNTLAEAQKLPSQTVMRANAAIVGASSYGQFGFGPFVDGTFMPALPGALFASGAYHREVQVVVGHNQDEGLLFTGPGSNNSAGFDAAVQQNFPKMSASVRAYLGKQIYPTSDYEGIEAYIDRTKQLIGDVLIDCNAYFVTRAFGSRAHAYLFAVPPAVHGADLPYTFNSGGNTTSVIASASTALQRYLATFVTTGVPPVKNGNVASTYPTSSTSVTVFGASNVSTAPDDTDNSRCRFWQKAQVEHLF